MCSQQVYSVIQCIEHNSGFNNNASHVTNKCLDNSPLVSWHTIEQPTFHYNTWNFCLFLQFVWYRRTNNCKYGNLFWKQVQVIKMAVIPFWHLSNTHIERNCVTCKFFLSCRWKVMGLFPNAYFYNLEISTAQLWKNSQKWLFFLFI